MCGVLLGGWTHSAAGVTNSQPHTLPPIGSGLIPDAPRWSQDTSGSAQESNQPLFVCLFVCLGVSRVRALLLLVPVCTG